MQNNNIDLEEEDGKSFLDICKMIWREKIILLIVTVAVFIVGTLLIAFWYNPSKVAYTGSFNLEFDGSDSQTFINGRKFNYKDIISKKNLILAKDSDSKFSDIDVENLYKKNLITITVSEDDATLYTITVTKSKIKDSDLMADYVEALVNNYVSYIVEQNNSVDYTTSYDLYKDYYYYEGLDFLSDKADDILSKYGSLVSKFGGDYIIYGQSLSTEYEKVKTTIDKLLISYYKNQALTNLYVDSEDSKTLYQKKAKAIVEDDLLTLEKNALVVKEYKDMLSQAQNYTELMTSIANQNASIYQELKYYTNASDVTTLTLDNYETYLKEATVASSDYQTEISKIYSTLLECGADLEQITSTLYNASIDVTYQTNSIVEASGSINIILGALISLVIGLVIACVACYIVAAVKESNEKKNSTSKELEEPKEE